jgi:hypothetical protein
MNRVKLFPRYLVDNGLIFEINRRVLHPLGLALVVDIDVKDRRKLSITDLFETQDPEGFLYDKESFLVGQEKFQAFLKSYQTRLEIRKAKYGFIEQDKEDVEPDS